MTPGPATSADPGIDLGTGPGSGLCNCLALRRAARRATALYDAAMVPYGLRVSQFAVLSRLRLCGPVGVQALAAVLLLDRTTLGRNLRPLERDGLVRSEADPVDKRVRRLLLTPAGLAAVQAATEGWHEAQKRFEAEYGADNAASLRAALRRVTDVFGAEPD